MPKGIPLTEEEQIRRRREIFDAAAHLFVEKGFNETSMREIARTAGIGASTLYDYFTTKDEILLSAISEWMGDFLSDARAIAGGDTPVVERLRLLMRRNLEYLISRRKNFFKFSTEVQRLSAESQKKIRMLRHSYQDIVQALIEEGIAEGSIRQVNPVAAARTMIMAISPAAFSTRPTGTPDQMLDEVLDILLHGILA